VPSRSAGRLLALALSVLMAGTAFAEEAESYKVRPQTRMKVNIVEWVAGTGEYKEWTALNGEYIVSPKGVISIPLLGELPAEGLTTTDIANEIGQALKAKTGLAEPPVATVEVVKYPMLYVSGSVDRPGEVEFRPGLTVMQAVAMAGGRERKVNQTGGYSEIDQIRYVGELSRYELLLKQYAARRARLIAEVGEIDHIEIPPEVGATDEGTVGGRIMADEERLFRARTEELKRQLDSFNDLAVLLKSEITVLEEKMVSQDRQIKIAEEELASIARLVDQKALARNRESTSERLVADLRSDKLDLVVAAMRAKQKLSETDRDAITLRGQRRIEAGRDLQAVEAEIQDTKLKRDTALRLLQITGASLSRYEELKATELQPVEYWVTRRGSNKTAAKVAETDPLEPGDVLDVRYDLSSSMESAAAPHKQTQ
jgi:protein involved in polysaccharide export with SLBB domain